MAEKDTNLILVDDSPIDQEFFRIVLQRAGFSQVRLTNRAEDVFRMIGKKAGRNSL